MSEPLRSSEDCVDPERIRTLHHSGNARASAAAEDAAVLDFAQPISPSHVDRATVPLPQLDTIDDFPLEILPALFREAIREASNKIQAARALSGMSAITIASFVAQQHVDTLTTHGGQEPCSLYTMTIAKSGDRKTTVSDEFTKGIRDHIAAIREERTIERRAWNMRYANGMAELGKLKMGRADSHERQNYERQKQEILDAIGPPIWSATSMVTSATVEALYMRLEKWRPSMMMETSEGGLMFGGYSMRDENMLNTLGWFCSLWDGKPVERGTMKTSEDGGLDNRRMAVMVSGQPDVMIPALKNKLLMDQGFLARTLLAFPPSLQGTRTADSEFDQGPIDRFNARLLELYKTEPFSDRDVFQLRNRAMPWTVEAQAARKAEVARVEPMLVDGGDLTDMRALANRIVANASRLATVFAFIETAGPYQSVHPDGAIPIHSLDFGSVTLDHWNAALAVAWYSVNQWRRLLGGGKADDLTGDALRVVEKLKVAHQRAIDTNGEPALRRGEFSWGKLCKLRANAGLNGAKGDAAFAYLRDDVLPYLVDKGHLHERKIRNAPVWCFTPDTP
jgi:hypothetical protein